MNVLCVIPARGGSKSVQRKNLRMVGGKPLLCWSISAGLQSFQTLGSVVVSTDDEEIARVAREYGAEVLDRPAELATDEAATDPVLVHALRTVQAERAPIDLVVLLQPTVPYRRPWLIDECIQRAIDTGADSVLTLSPLHFVWWVEDEYQTGAGVTAKRWRSQCPRRPRRQDFYSRERMYAEDGSVYVTKASYLLEHGARIGGHVEAVFTERTVDVDSEADLRLADALLGAPTLEAVWTTCIR